MKKTKQKTIKFDKKKLALIISIVIFIISFCVMRYIGNATKLDTFNFNGFVISGIICIASMGTLVSIVLSSVIIKILNKRNNKKKTKKEEI